MAEVLALARIGLTEEEIAAVFVANAAYTKEKHGEQAADEAFGEALTRREVRRGNRSLESHQKIACFGVRAEKFEKPARNKVKTIPLPRLRNSARHKTS